MIATPLRIVFFGTPTFAVAVLEELHSAGIEPTLVVTAPDRPKGRGLVVTPPDVKVWAERNNIDVLQPESVKDPAFIGELRNTEWNLFIVAAYGKILPQELLSIPKHGTLNVHPSLLPKFRGASPIQSQILADERETGVSIMLIDEEMDHGPLVAQASITPETWPLEAPVLEELLAREGGQLLAEIIPAWVRGEITPEAQDHSQATYTKKITKEDGRLDLTGEPYQNFLKIQAFKKWPGAYFIGKRNGQDIRVKVAAATFENDELRITRVIPEGKSEMSYDDFLRGHA